MQYLMREVVTHAADNATLDADRIDIMSALAVAREYCHENDLKQCQLYIRAVGALARFLGFRNALSERVTWGKSALEVAVLIGDDLAIAELCSSTIAWPLLQLGDYPETERYCLEGLKAAGRCGNSGVAARWAGNASRSLCGIARDADDGSKAQHWAEKAEMYGRRCGDESLIRGAKLDFGYAAMLLGNFEEAERLFANLLEEEERGGDDERVGNRSGDLALAIMNQALRCDDIAERTRLCDRASANMERGLRLGIKISHSVMVGEGEMGLATLARIRGDEREYQRLIASGRRHFEKLGIRRKGRAEQFVTFLREE
ncbi:hypothetical protein [Streptomyces melanogenes]|uniref:hypothetical protein n=1 Tax=Streptomyces melanogenes TaxID=67326 RepID=UPI00379E91FC